MNANATGPVKGMFQAAALMGGTLRADQRGFYIDFNGTQPRLDINDSADATWRRAARKSIQNAIVRQLNARVVNPDDPGNEHERRGKRKDLYGIGNAVDDYAINVNLKGRATTLVKKLSGMWTACQGPTDLDKYSKDTIQNQRLQAILAGSLRAPDRLFRAKLIDNPRCKFCPCQLATLDHTTWDCPFWNETRRPYMDLLHAYRDYLVKAGSAARVAAFDALLKLPCVRNCGITPEAEYFKEGGAPIPQQRVRFAMKNDPEHQLHPQQRDSLQRDDSGRILAYTDGSAVHPADPRRRRASWAVHYAKEHPWNLAGPVADEIQTAYRGELLAAVHVLKSASAPTCIVSDCLAVVETIRNELEGIRHPIKGDHADLYAEVRTAIAEKPEQFFAVKWINSHLPLCLAGEVEEQGGFRRRDIEGNHFADEAAKKAIEWHDIKWVEYDMADDREFVACVTQAMMADVWSRVFDQDKEIRAHEEAEMDEYDAVDGDARGDSEAHTVDVQPEPSVLDPLALPNRRLATYIRNSTPGYCWEVPRHHDHHTVSLPDLPHPVVLQPRGQQAVKGRGVISTSFIYPPHYAEPVRWWWNKLRWQHHRHADGPNSPNGTATYLECVVDMELSTGFKLGEDGACGKTWAEKARVLAYIVRTLARVHTVECDGQTTTLRKAVAPCTDATSLTPLGAPVLSGYGRRPKWLSDRTPEVAAYNVWRAREHEKRTITVTTNRNPRLRSFARNWEINYQGYPTENLWTPTSTRTFFTITRGKRVDDARADCDGTEERTIAKRRRIEDDTAVTTEDITPPSTRCLNERPLPAYTREQKKARLNEPELEVASARRGSRFSSTSPSTLGAPSSSTSASSSGYGHPTEARAGEVYSKAESEQIRPATAQGSMHGGTNKHDLDDLRCRSCWAYLRENNKFRMPKGVKGKPWRGVRAGELLCGTCFYSFSNGVS